MRIDEIDLNMFLFFLENRNDDCTVVDVVKELFKPKNRNEMIRKVSMLNYRLNKWVKEGLFSKIKENGRYYYIINAENIHYDDSLLKVGDKTIETGKAIVFEMKDNNYVVCFLEQDV